MTPLQKKQEIMSAFAAYQRWLREGKLHYGPDRRDPTVPYQYYYDGYHASINPKDEPDVYSFSIQLSDSPDGDCWWYGKFRVLNGGTDVEILEEKSEYR